MIRPLRQRHRWQINTLGILLPMVFILGLAARKPVPLVASLPSGLAPSSLQYATEVGAPDHLFSKSPVTVHLWSQQNSSGPFAVSFSAPPNFIRPDLMVYWLRGSPSLSEDVMTNAILVGSFGPAPLSLTEEEASTAGELVLYSLADGEIVDVSRSVRLINGGQPTPE